MVACLIVDGFGVPMDVEMCGPGEGEITAAKRLLERVLSNYPRFFDAVIGDSLYFQAPFTRLCREHGKHVIVTMKDDNRLLYKDARDVLELVEPELWERNPRHHIKAWDVEGFTSFEGVDEPIRVLHTEETVIERTKRRGKWVMETQVHNWWWATTVPKLLMPTRPLCEASHRRWDVENRVFHALATHWHMDHCFKHEPTAILNFVLILFIAYILVQTFLHRNMRPEMRRRFSLTAIARELLQGLTDPDLKAPWVRAARRPDS